MSKVTLGTVTNILGNPSSAATQINNNSQAIAAAIENTLSRDGTSPNMMAADIDMNGFDLLNVNSISVNDFNYEGQPVGELVQQAGAAAVVAVAAGQHAYEWAQSPEDVPVNDGVHTGYSAYHWSKKAEGAAGGGVSNFIGLTGSISLPQAQTVLQLSTYALANLSNVSQTDARTKVGTGTNAYRNLTVSASAPSGGTDGDVWYQT